MSTALVPYDNHASDNSVNCFNNFMTGVLFTFVYGALVAFISYTSKHAMSNSNPENPENPPNTYKNCVNRNIMLKDLSIIHVIGPKNSGKTALATRIASEYGVFKYFDPECNWKDITRDIGDYKVVVFDQCQLSRRQMKNHIDYLEDKVRMLIIVGDKVDPWLRYFYPFRVCIARRTPRVVLSAIYEEQDNNGVCNACLSFDFATLTETCRKLCVGEFAVLENNELATCCYDGDVVLSQRVFSDEDAGKIESLTNVNIYRSTLLTKAERRVSYLERANTAKEHRISSLQSSISRLQKKRANESMHAWARPVSPPPPSENWTLPVSSVPLVENRTMSVTNDANNTDSCMPILEWHQKKRANESKHPFDAVLASTTLPVLPVSSLPLSENVTMPATSDSCKPILEWNAATKWHRLAEQMTANVVAEAGVKHHFGKVLNELKSMPTDEEKEIRVEECNFNAHMIVVDKGVTFDMNDCIKVDKWENLERAIDLQSGKPIWCHYNVTDTFKDPEIGAKIVVYSSWVGCYADLSQFDKLISNIDMFVFDPAVLDEAQRRGIYFNICSKSVRTFRMFDALCEHFKKENVLLCYSIPRNRIEWMTKI